MTASDHDANPSHFEEELTRQLAVTEIPSVPVELDSEMRRRLNQALFASHWIDFLTVVIPGVIATLLNPIGHLIRQTFTGRHRRSSGSRQDD